MAFCELTDTIVVHGMQGSVSSVESDASANGGPASGLSDLPIDDTVRMTSVITVAAA